MYEWLLSKSVEKREGWVFLRPSTFVQWDFPREWCQQPSPDSQPTEPCAQSFNFMLVVTISSDFRVQENKVCHCFHFSPSVRHEVLGPDAMILVFWMLSFMPAFLLSSFTLIKRLFHYSTVSAIRVVSSAYLRLLMFLLVILIPAWDSSSLVFSMMYST